MSNKTNKTNNEVNTNTNNNGEKDMKKVNEVLAILTANQKTRGSKKSRENVMYTFTVPSDLSGIQLAPQALKIIACLLSEDESEWNEPTLMDIVASIEELSAKQTNWKIFQYYRKQFIDAGFLSMVK